MGLTMTQILNKFNDCDTFSLTGRTSKYVLTISDEEYDDKTKSYTQKEIWEF